MNIRLFESTDSDYEALLAIIKLVQPEEELTIAMLQEQDEAMMSSNMFVRVLGEIDNQVIASGVYWPTDEDSYLLNLSVIPDYQDSSAPSLLHTYLLSKLEETKTSEEITIVSEPKEDELYRTQLLEESNFKLKMRFPRSQLDLNSFDTSPYTTLQTQLTDQDIEFITLSAAMKTDTNWQKNIWQLFTIIDQDVPYPDPQKSISFEDYSEYYEGDLFRPDSWIIAIDTSVDLTQEDQQRYVGMCVVNVMPTRPDTLYAGITGVVPSHRRKGIATMLKVLNIQYAKKQGFKYLYTDNEENNPMYDLNIQLGFAPLPAWVYYEKQIS